VVHNVNKKMRVNQYGGRAIMAMNTIAPEVVESGADHTSLGRWCWIRIGSGAKKTRIVMAYQSSNSGRSTGTTVKDQHAQYFTAFGDTHSPRTIFFEQLITQLIQWKAIDNGIILLSNFNKNVYTGRIARRLGEDDLNFTEVCRRHTGRPIPPTFRTGSVPIDGIFATVGIECINTFTLPHYGGVGNHRCFILNLSSESLIGTLFPNIVQCVARKLHYSSKRMISVYNAELTKTCDDHNMFQRMDTIYRLTDYLTTEDFSLLMNS
jgi:hypothetical protein